MVRLVFRPYTQISRSICTSESLRASTRVSPGFAPFRHSSPSFGSQHARSHSNLAPGGTWSVDGATLRLPTCIHFHCARGFQHPCTRGHVPSLLLGSHSGRYFGTPGYRTWLFGSDSGRYPDTPRVYPGVSEYLAYWLRSHSGRYLGTPRVSNLVIRVIFG